MSQSAEATEEIIAAVRAGDCARVEAYVEGGASVDTRTQEGRTLLQLTATLPDSRMSLGMRCYLLFLGATPINRRQHRLYQRFPEIDDAADLRLCAPIQPPADAEFGDVQMRRRRRRTSKKGVRIAKAVSRGRVDTILARRSGVNDRRGSVVGDYKPVT